MNPRPPPPPQSIPPPTLPRKAAPGLPPPGPLRASAKLAPPSSPSSPSSPLPTPPMPRNAARQLTGLDLTGPALAKYLRECVPTADPFDRAHGCRVANFKHAPLLPAAVDDGYVVHLHPEVHSVPRLVHKSQAVVTDAGVVSIDSSGDALFDRSRRLAALVGVVLAPAAPTLQEQVACGVPARPKTYVRLSPQERLWCRAADELLARHP